MHDEWHLLCRNAMGFAFTSSAAGREVSTAFERWAGGSESPRCPPGFVCIFRLNPATDSEQRRPPFRRNPARGAKGMRDNQDLARSFQFFAFGRGGNDASGAVLGKRPAVPVRTFESDEVYKELISALEWMVCEIKAS